MLLLREIHKEIAESNGIVYFTKECSHSENCSGSCDITATETRYLEAERSRMIMAKEEIFLGQLRLEKIASANDLSALDLWSYMKKSIRCYVPSPILFSYLYVTLSSTYILPDLTCPFNRPRLIILYTIILKNAFA